MLQKLILGEVDVIIGSHALAYVANKLIFPYLKIINQIPNSALDVVFSIRKDYPEAVSILNKGLDSIPKYEKTILINKWFFKHQKTVDFTIQEKEYLQNNPVLTVQNLSTFPPFNFNENGIPKGYTIDYMKLMADYMGVNIKFISGKPWNDYLTMLKEGSLDIIPHIAINNERKQFVDFTNFKHIEFITGIAINKKNNISSMNDLQDKIIAITKNTFLHTYLKNKFPKQKLLLTKNIEQSIEAISLGKAYVAIGSLPSLNYYIQKSWHNNIKISTIDDLDFISKTQLPMGVSKGNRILKSILEKANNSIPHNEVVKLKQKWMTIKTSDNTENTLSNEEVIYLDKKKEIKMCVNPDGLPFEQIDKEGIYKGIGSEVMKLVSKYINTEITLLPTKERADSLQNIRNRKCDILPIAMNIPNHRDVMSFTRPFISEPFVIATKLDQLFIKDSQDIGNRKIGIIKSYTLIELLKEKYPNINIVTVKSAKDGLEQVQSGKLFGYVDIMPAIGYTMQKYSMIDLKIAGKLEFEIEFSIASRNDEPILNSILQKALDNISKEQIRTIVSKWISIKVEQTIDYTKILYTIAFFSIILIVVLYKSRLIKQVNNKLSLANEEISELLITDPLTNLYNRRYFNHISKIELKRSIRHQHNFILMMIDIDYFKQYNDTYGHHEGDLALVSVANSLRTSLHRPEDYVFRIGGEEFCVITSDISAEGIVQFANKIRTNVENLHLEHKGNKSGEYLTISIGVKNIVDEVMLDIDDIYQLADNALYKAKKEGRNRVIVD